MPPQGNPGMSPEILEAIRRRQQGDPSAQAQQVSPQAAGQPQIPQPMPPSAMTASSAPPSAPQAKFQPQDRKDLIVMALVDQLKLENKADQQRTNLAQTQPMGGGGDSVGRKIGILRNEGYPQRQSVAIAMDMKRRGAIGGGMSRMQMQDGMSGTQPTMGGGYYER